MRLNKDAYQQQETTEAEGWEWTTRAKARHSMRDAELADVLCDEAAGVAGRWKAHPSAKAKQMESGTLYYICMNWTDTKAKSHIHKQGVTGSAKASAEAFPKLLQGIAGSAMNLAIPSLSSRAVPPKAGAVAPHAPETTPEETEEQKAERERIQAEEATRREEEAQAKREVAARRAKAQAKDPEFQRGKLLDAVNTHMSSYFFLWNSYGSFRFPRVPISNISPGSPRNAPSSKFIFCC